MENFPYFQFNASKWLFGDISDCSEQAQALFISICCHYWMTGGDLSLNRVQKKIKSYKNDAFKELVDGCILKVNTESKISISFLSEQIKDIQNLVEKRSEMGKKSAESRAKKLTQAEPRLNTGSTEVERRLNSSLNKKELPFNNKIDKIDRYSTTPVKGVVRTTTSESTNTDIRAPLWGRLSSWIGIEFAELNSEQIQTIEKDLTEIQKLKDSRMPNIWASLKNSDQELFDKTMNSPGMAPIVKIRAHMSANPQTVIRALLDHITPNIPEENEN